MISMRGPFYERDEEDDFEEYLCDMCLDCDELYFEDIWNEAMCNLNVCKNLKDRPKEEE